MEIENLNLQKQIDSLQTTINSINTNITNINSSISLINTNINSLKTDMNLWKTTRGARMYLWANTYKKITLRDNYVLVDIPLDGTVQFNGSSYFSKSGNYIKILKKCEISIHAEIDFCRVEGGDKSSDYCFDLLKGTTPLSESVIHLEDNSGYHHTTVSLPILQCNANDLIKFQAMARVGGGLEVFGDNKKVRTFLCVELLSTL